MPIQSLSDSTSRVLTSAQSLNNATSVIKELVDNALDARASSISIEISANTLDKIIVRDDGTGIGVQDRQLLCKRGCTSKIANLDDLAKLGGTFLGFRGTALASVAELSKEVTVVTKVDGEQPATTMTFGPSGKLLSSGSASHNDGTTIRVEHFLTAIPVRRQVGLKDTSKILDEIQKLLQGYALARPKVKLSLKVLKAKNDKANWSFAACQGENLLLSAAAQVVGKAIAGLCQLQTVCSDEGGFRIEALLLDNRNKGISKTGSVGPYISVDGRPVSPDKGIMKLLVKKYKSHLQHTSVTDEPIPSKPFLVLHLHCPDRSYDVNVEPAKDVVLFHDQRKVLDLAEKLFVECYGDLEGKEAIVRNRSRTSPQKTNPSSFDVLLACKKPEATERDRVNKTVTKENEIVRTPSKLPGTLEEGESLVESFAEAMKRMPSSTNSVRESSRTQFDLESTIQPKYYQSTYAVDDELGCEGSELVAGQADLGHAEDYDPADITINNPFVRAKVYSIQRPKPFATRTGRLLKDMLTEQSPFGTASHSSPTTNPPFAHDRISQTLPYNLPTPVASPQATNAVPYQNPGPPVPRRSKRAHGEEDEEIYSDRDGQESFQLPQQPRQTTIAGWARSPTSKDHSTFRSPLPLNCQDFQSNQHHSLSGHWASPRTVLYNMQTNTGTTKSPDFSLSKTPQSAEALAFNNARRHASASQGIQALSPVPPDGSNLTFPEADDDLRQILDFEQRKKKVNQRQRLNQVKLPVADKARTQQGSHADAYLEPLQASQSESKCSIDSFAAPVDLTAGPNKARSNVQQTPTKAPNPHQNRYVATIRNLQPHANNDKFVGDFASAKSLPGVNELFPGPRQRPSLPATDPRGYFISLHQPQSPPNNSRAKLTRIKSSRLPFEAIPPECIKHDLLATSSTLFPSAENLLILSRALAKCDVYVEKGEIDTVVWSPACQNLDCWQETLKSLVNKQYRARINAPSEDEEGSEQVPNMNILLARAFNAHVNSA